jgi:hypothetical protein
LKRGKGDREAAERMHEKAMALSAEFENYAEIAALHFRMAWNNGEPVMRNPFSNPTSVTVRSHSDRP